VTLSPSGLATPSRPRRRRGVLRELAAATDSMPAFPRVDHLRELGDLPLQVRDPRLARRALRLTVTQRLLQFADAVALAHPVERAPSSVSDQDSRARPRCGTILRLGPQADSPDKLNRHVCIFDESTTPFDMALFGP